VSVWPRPPGPDATVLAGGQLVGAPIQAAPERADVGEGPVTTASGRELLWVDIVGCRLYRTNLVSGRTDTLEIPQMLGAVVECVDGSLVAAVASGFAAITPDNRYEERLSCLPPDERMNDAKCDPAGRLWAGSTEMGFAAGRGKLHVLSDTWTTRVALDGLTLPNGLGWSPEGERFYLVDSIPRTLTAYPYDPVNGVLGAGQVLVRFPDVADVPDGLAVDAQGNLWVAIYDGGRIEVFDPRGEALGAITLPVRRPTSCCLDSEARLWITSARDDPEPAPSGLDGALLVASTSGVDALAPARFGAGRP